MRSTMLVVVRRAATASALCCITALVAWAQIGTPGHERIVGLPCEGCDAVYVGLPDTLGAQGRIAPEGERGEPLQLRGRVLDAAGAPVPGVVLYAYHTDSSGHYPPDASLAKTSAAPNGRLRGWARSDARGEYRFETIRPGPYPGRPAPQHIHMHVLEVGRCTYYIGDVMFTDDPRLTAELRESAARDRAGSGVVTPERDANGVWQAERDIRLGLNVPGYGACD